jgi:hypothetical protein
MEAIFCLKLIAQKSLLYVALTAYTCGATGPSIYEEKHRVGHMEGVIQRAARKLLSLFRVCV